MCKIIHLFSLQIMFGSIFNACHGAPILCCTTTDLWILLCKIGIFDTVLGIFGVAFVRALNTNYNGSAR